jgi:arylsulfatase A-like enzyme
MMQGFLLLVLREVIMFQRGFCLVCVLMLGGIVTAAERPNMLFCLADDWGWPHAGAYGDPVVATPTFDRLAREGVLFEYAFISSPSCTPSRNAMLTGQQFYRLDHGANLHSTLDPRHPNLMFQLRDAGYEIGHWRKAWGPGDFKALGYDEHPCGPESTFDKFIQQRDASRPFCFWFGTSDPHRPYKKGSGEASGMDLAKVPVPDFLPDVDQVRSDIADYYWEVQRWDGDVGAALKLLEEVGELDNTIVVMSGDHGMPFPRCKGNLYDWGARVPLAIRWGASAKPGRRVKDFASLTDLAPTFLQAAGLEIPDTMTGRSLVPVLTAAGEGRIDPERDFMVFGRERHVPAQKMPSLAGYPARAIRTDRWLLVLNLQDDRWPAGVPTGATHPMDVHADCDNGPTKSFLVDHRDDPSYAEYYERCFAKRPAVELYDCVADPDQVNNLAADPSHAETIEQLHGRLIEYLRATADPRFTDAPVKFDEYPYRAGYLQQYLQKKGY